VTASSYLTFFWVAMTGGRFICYLLAKRVGEKKLLSGLSLCSFFFYGLFLLSTKPEISGAVLVCVGLFFSGIFPLIISLGIGVFPSSPNTTNGFLLACMGSGVLIFPFAIGAISSKFTLTAGMASILLFMLVFLALSLLLFIKRFSGKG
jgi:fucose permease